MQLRTSGRLTRRPGRDTVAIDVRLCQIQNSKSQIKLSLTRFLFLEEIRKKYVGRSVDEYLKKYAQNPVQYVNC